MTVVEMEQPQEKSEVAFMCECCGEVEILVGEKYVLRANDERHSIECFEAERYTEHSDDYGIYTATKP